MTETPRSQAGAGCMAQVGAAFAIGFALFVPAFVQTVVAQLAWLGEITKTPYTTPQVLLFSLLHPISLALLALGLFLTRGPRYRALLQTLLASAGIALLLLIPRVVFPPDSVYGVGLARLVITLVCALVLLVVAVRRGVGMGWSAIPAAFLLAALFVVPWVRLGALGDRLDILLALAQGLALGLLAAGLIGGLLIPGLQAQSGGRGWDLALGGSTVAAALLGIGGAFGQDDIQALMMPTLAGVAFAATALALPERDGRPGILGPALLVGIVATLPLAFADPEEISLIVALSGDTYSFTQAAAFWCLLIGLLLWGPLQLLAGRLPRLTNPLVATGIAAVLWLGAGAAYATSGQTGLHGNYAFVILKEQADVSQAAQIGDLTERRRFVYTTLVETADRSQANIRALLDSRGVPYTPFYLVNAIEVEGDALLQAEIAGLPEVDRVIFSQTMRPLPVPGAPEEASGFVTGDPEWGISAIGADRVWDELGVRGEGIVIGQSDSGVDWMHPALQAAYRGADGRHDYNWLDPWTGRHEPWDGNGHGTHTIGTVLGADGIGVAPGAQWFGCANLVRNIGNPADYLRCMQFMLAPYPLDGDALRDGDPARAADVSTNSWGCPPIEGCDEESLLPGVRALRAAGIFFVAAAGNEGAACDSLRTPPGNYASAISVGAIDIRDELTSFSSRGPLTDSPDGRTAPTILAPGRNITSAWPGGGYQSSDGTSMATPHVAGVVALIWSANPALRGDVATTERILIETARPYEGEYTGCGDPTALPNPESGYGIVDAYAAVQRAIELR